jgi:hypothetical protein
MNIRLATYKENAKAHETRAGSKLQQQHSIGDAAPLLESETDVYPLVEDEDKRMGGGFQNCYDNCDEDDSSMKCYQETHEEQLPSYGAFLKRLKEEAVQRELVQFDQKDLEERSQLEPILVGQIKEKMTQTEKSVEKYKSRVKQDEKRDHNRLNMLYRQRTESNQTKISQSMKILQRRHQKAIQTAMQQHQQRAHERQLPEQMVTADWQLTLRQIQAKQQRQLQEFNSKGEEIKRKTDADYKREQEKIRTTYEGKTKEADVSRQKLAGKLYSHFQQLRQRYLKRHLQRVVKEREELMKPVVDEEEKTDADPGNDKAFTRRELAKTTMEEKAELNPPSPIKSMLSWAAETPYPSAGAAARHKHRKGVMSQTRRELSVEIHNEGIWVSVVKSSASEEDGKRTDATKSDSSSSPEDQELIPWGIKAHTFLESVVCGEIPAEYDQSNAFEELAAMQGGQVRCILSDLRTSEEAASSHRAASVRELEASDLDDLEKKQTELHTLASEAEKAASKAESEEKECLAAAEATVKEVTKARRCQEEFRNKFRNYLGPGTCKNLEGSDK